MSDIPLPEIPAPPPLEDRPFGRTVLGILQPTGINARIALTLAAGVSCLIFAGACRLFQLPPLPGFDGSLFLQPSPFTTIIIIAVLVLITTLVGTVLAGAVHFEAGLFAAAFGMMAISLRCGTIQSVLFEANGSSSVFFRLAGEVLILAVILAVAWLMLRQIARAVHGTDIAPPAADSNLLNNLTATISQTVITAVIIMVLCQSETKNQCLASVGIASMLGSIMAYKYAATRPSFWYWSGPLLAGFVGYALAALGQDGNLNIGSPTGLLAALARPLPIDYASVGVAGAIFGYWVSSAPAA